MANEEKIKAFLNDEEKVKALANDTEFIEKVSGGQATNETYRKEFEKFDIKLSDQDAEKTKDVVNKMLEKSPAKIDDEFLKSVVGGGMLSFTAARAASLVTLMSSLGCGIASCVYMGKAKKAHSTGNIADYEQFIKKSQNCGIATAALVGSGLMFTRIAYKVVPLQEFFLAGKEEGKKEATTPSSNDNEGRR